MVQLLNSIYLGAATPSDYGKAAGVVELLPFDYYLGAAVPSHGKPTVNVLLSGVSPLTLLNAISLNYVKVFGKCEQRNLPKGYKQLEYIIFDSTQVLDTDFTPNNNSRIESKCYRTGTNCWFYGASPNNPRVTLFHSDSGTSRWGNQSRSNLGFVADTKYTLIQDKNGLSINGTLYPWNTGTAGDFTCDRSLTIGNNNGSTGTRYFAGNFYYMKIYDNNVLVRDYVPVKRISDNSLGIYDRVNDTFLTASGFVAGAEVVPTPDYPVDIVCNNGTIKARHQSGLPLGYTLLDYTRSSATQYIDLGYKGNGNTKVEVKFKYYQTSNATGSGRVFGSRTNSTTNAFAIGSSSGVVASSDNKIFWCYDGQNFYVSANSFALGEWQTVLFSATEHKINGTIEGSDYTVTTFETPSNLMLFAFDNNATIGCGYVDIAYCKLWNNGVLVRDLVSAKNSLNEVGMYDLVSGKFFTNAGTGAFIAGNPVSDSVEIYYDGTVETANVYSPTLIEESDVTDGMGINSQNGIPVANPDRCIFTPFFVKAGTKVIWSATASKLGGYLIQYSQPVASAAYWISSITATPVEYVAGEYMRSATATEDCYVVCQGTASWEEMKNYNWRVTKLASTATCQPLLSVGTTKDVQNITNGEVTRKLGVYVVTGAEDWSYNDRYIRYQATINSLERADALYEFLCTHGVSSTGTQGTWSIRTNKILAFYDNKSEFASLDIFKKFLADEYAAGHPAIIVYEKETPTTETVTGQTLTITKGTNVVTAEGSVSDLELEVSYKAYAEVTVEEIEAVNTDENVEVIIS